MKRLLLLLIGTMAVLGCIRPTVPEKEKESGNVTIMVVSATEAPRILENITEEMLIDRVISESKKEDGERNRSEKDIPSAGSVFAVNTGKASAGNESDFWILLTGGKGK